MKTLVLAIMSFVMLIGLVASASAAPVRIAGDNLSITADRGAGGRGAGRGGISAGTTGRGNTGGNGRGWIPWTRGGGR